MNSKQLTEPSMTIDHVGGSDHYNYGQIGKGILHALIVPVLIGIWFPPYALVYVLCATFLYSTVFRHKSDGFFGTIVFMLAIAAMMIVPG